MPTKNLKPLVDINNIDARNRVLVALLDNMNTTLATSAEARQNFAMSGFSGIANASDKELAKRAKEAGLYNTPRGFKLAMAIDTLNGY